MKASIKAFESRIQEMTEKNIMDFSKHDNSVLNVIRGHQNEAFATMLWDDSKPNFDYFLLYTTKSKNKLEGFILRLNPNLKTRNELTAYFASFLCKRYNIQNYNDMFNTYQDQQRSLFERLDYSTYDDSLKEELKGRKGELFLKGSKGLLYVPFAKGTTEEKS